MLQVFRQAHPTLILIAEITSHVFRPTPEAHGCPSAYDGNLITTERSWEHYARRLKRQSVGVECTEDFRSGTTAYPKRTAA